MDSLIKFLKDKITDKTPLEEIVDVFEQMCNIPLEEDMILFETGTFTSFSPEPVFEISLVRQFPNDDEEHKAEKAGAALCLCRDIYRSPVSDIGECVPEYDGSVRDSDEL